jgi:hypothetical protein
LNIAGAAMSALMLTLPVVAGNAEPSTVALNYSDLDVSWPRDAVVCGPTGRR